MRVDRTPAALSPAAVLLIATAAVAGPPAPGAQEARRTTTYVQAGLSSGSSDTGAALGATIVRDLTARLSLEASGSYLDRGTGAEAISLSASLLVHLRHSDEKIVPYLTAGAGLYRASFDIGDPRFFGPGGPQFTGMGPFAPGAGPATGTHMYGQMPGFYGMRLPPVGAQGGTAWHRSFTDPAFAVGGGARIDVGPRLFLRPDARALVVTAKGDTHTVGVFTLSLGYRF